MHSDDGDQAPGGPGGEARWTSSAKSGVGTAIGGRVWFTLSHGILNEVYYPRVDQACVRDLGLIVTDHAGRFFSEEKRHARHQVAGLADGVPAYRLTNTCDAERYRIDKEVVADPRREVVLQRITFTALQGATADYAVYALLAPHLGNAGADNTGWVGDYKGRQFLFAERHGVALALACSSGWGARSVGFVGSSDGWQQLRQHGALTPQHQRAAHGNIALTGQLDLTASDRVELALGFGRTWAEAAHRASASLLDGFDVAAAAYRQGWGQWQVGLRPPPPGLPRTHALYRASTAVLRTHASARFPGALVASLSVPWGASKGDGDLGGYHLVWPRDLVESAGGLLAIGADDEVRRVLTYLAVTQEADGHWPQNMWIDGTPYWHGIQMDETGFPILLVDLARRRGVLDDAALAQLWPMVRRAAQFIITNGPVTQQDRWEEDPGYAPFTLAVEIAALLAAADLARVLEPRLVDDLHATADAWNDAIERWTYVTGTALAGQVGVDGYYVRVAAPGTPTPRRPRAASCRSRTGRRAKTARRPRTWSAPTRSRWCSSGCALPTTPAWSPPPR
ncbi:MAG: glycoside hydrolase family 15 protein [Kofleriaceae bacterium]